jgi:excinuclease ABC subunit A
MARDSIVIRGAREHNLKNIDLEIPRDKFIVFTGVSGSGKSSLAFDTLYAEGQRRYVESLSAYARQFLEKMEKPNVEYIDGLSPAIAIEQKSASKNPRSTVGTVTEIHDYLRVLYARIGKPYCYKCGEEITSQTVDQIVDRIMSLPEGTRIHVLGPLIKGRKGEYRALLDEMRRQGYVRARINGEITDLDQEIRLDEKRKHDIEIVVDRLLIKPDIRSRLAESVETALKLGEGKCIVEVVGKEDILFSEQFACPRCGISYGELTPQMFSFNNPQGMCRACEGLGVRMEVDPELVVPDPEKSLREGAIAAWGDPSGVYIGHILEGLSKHYKFSLDTPWKDLPVRVRHVLLYGSGDEEVEFVWRDRKGNSWRYRRRFEGIIPFLERRYREAEEEEREEIEQFMSEIPCPECQGRRLRPEACSVRIGGKSIVDVCAMSVKEAYRFFEELRLDEREMMIASEVLKEIKARLGFLLNVGLDYLTLDRKAPTLSGGEAQRIRLATQIGSGLMGVLYILDEPSVGLHQRDNIRLLNTLKKLRDLGNTVIVVEHDMETILEADYVVDFGPGAGAKGGYIVATGTPQEIMKNPHSITGKYLSGELKIPIPSQRRKPSGKWLSIIGASEHNLKNIDVHIPLGTFTCITGVSGSGKSTLIGDILYKALANKLHGARTRPGKYREIRGIENIDKVINIDQQPIGRTPRSNPATYIGAYDIIREVFSMTPEARARGYKPGRFSFNVKGGRCEACKGDGIKRIEMHFLSDVWVPCEVCKGLRYNRETLEITYKGKNIADVLDMTAQEALEHFGNIPRLRRILQTLCDVGLDYIKLGQPATTLSGGEAQRVKLAKELCRKDTGRTFYILDEPTTGLHYADVQKLLNVLQRLVDAGNTVVVIEHNLEVIKTADYIIDLGPEGGDEGGWVVAVGTPEEVASVPHSYTGQFLNLILNGTRVP